MLNLVGHLNHTNKGNENDNSNETDFKKEGSNDDEL